MQHIQHSSLQLVKIVLVLVLKGLETSQVQSLVALSCTALQLTDIDVLLVLLPRLLQVHWLARLRQSERSARQRGRDASTHQGPAELERVHVG